jgi:hypothetical protein
VGNLSERDHLQDTGVDGWIILECILKFDGVAWVGFICLKTEQIVGCFECGNELSDSIKCR